MNMEEFIERTDHKPTSKEWQLIVREYNRYPWEDKDMFCRRWLIENGLYHRIGQILRRKILCQ